MPFESVYSSCFTAVLKCGYALDVNKAPKTVQMLPRERPTIQLCDTAEFGIDLKASKHGRSITNINPIRLKGPPIVSHMENGVSRFIHYHFYSIAFH